MRDVSPESYKKVQEEQSNYMQKILDIMPEVLKEAYLTLETGYLDQSEVTLRTLLKPTAQQEAIRSRIWTLINERQHLSEPPRIQLSEVASGIASIKYVLQQFELPLMVAWCGVPTMNYETRVESMLDQAYARMKEILELPIMVEGKVDVKSANLILQVAKMVDLRSKGNYTERVESKTLQVNATAKEAANILGISSEASLEEIEAKIRMLEGGVPTEVKVIDVSQ